ncbi:MAG: [FeFe] hydrogenase H-cluster radical SAM maturase HydG, partial [Planctomycetota bacterium]
MNPDTRFLDEERIQRALKETENPSLDRVEEVLAKALEMRGLTVEESAVLLNAKHPELRERLYDAARKVKETIYGKRIVLFAPLYISNYCVNNCLY